MGLEKVIPLMLDILQRGKDVEIRTCKDGYKVLEVTRRTEVVVERETRETPEKTS